MNQSELSFFYRGVLVLLVAAFAVKLLSSIDQPGYVRTIAVALWMLGGAAFIVYVVSRQFGRFLNAPASDEPLPSSLYLDYWYHIARLAVMACVLLAVTLLAIMLFVQPPERCPDWHLPDKRSSSLWVPFFLFAVPILVIMSFVVTRWKWVVRKAIESTDYPTTIPVPNILAITVIMGCAMSLLPWGVLVSNCWLVVGAPE